jgi:hypothetical protein
MRYFEISSGLRLPICAEEKELLDYIGKQTRKTIDAAELSERQSELARRMVSRGLLRFHRKDNQLCYQIDSVDDIWRSLYDD